MGGAWSVSARESAQDDEQACDAAGRFKRRREHCTLDDVPSTVGGHGKHVRSCDDDGGSGSIVHYNGHQLHCSDEEGQSLLFSSSCRATASGNVQEPSGSRWNVQHRSLFEIDPTRHRIFLSHSGAQKNFVEQLCVDLEARGYLFPFFDQRHHSLPKGKDFVPLIKQAARQCHVAVIVLSEEFLCSKWPMIELGEFYAAKQGGNDGMNILPLFYKLSIDDLDDRSIEDRWMPKWHGLASTDKRIDVTQWVAAVRVLRRTNGLPFGKNTKSKVGYRKEIVQCIWKLSPGDLLHDSAREMVGYHRICQRLSNRFVEGNGVGASVLGLYGKSGFGKTTQSKALCDYFAREFVGRVCVVELGAMTRIERQKLMLKTLCGVEEDVLNRLTDDRKGLKLMRDWMNWEPVFLVIDNVMNDESSRKEAHEYLKLGFHPKSKIMITARSKQILQDLLPGVRFCMSIPRLNVEEAGRIFLKSADPMKCFSSLTDEERRIVRRCIYKCLLESDKDESLDEVEKYHDNSILNGFPIFGAFHPLALSALGDLFYRSSSNTEMLRWKDNLDENNELKRDVLQSPSITSIIGLQFSTFNWHEQLLFLDVAFYYISRGSIWFLASFHEADFQFLVEWLSTLHGETTGVIERRLWDLKRSGMIDWINRVNKGYVEVVVHSLYREFAAWYLREHGLTGLKNTWGAFETCGTSLGSRHPRSKCISDLVRLQVNGYRHSTNWTLMKKRMIELQNLVLLQIYDCADLRELSLEGLDSLRHLELLFLSNLVKVTVTRSSGSQEDGGIFGSLQYVVLERLDSLTHVPDFRSCTSLRFLKMMSCKEVTNFKGVECPHLKEFIRVGLAQHQLERPLNFGSLHSLTVLHMQFDGAFDILGAMDVHVSPNSLKPGRHVEVAMHQGPKKDSDEFSANSDAGEYEDVFEERTIINMHLEIHFGKEGLSIVQKILPDLYQKEWGQLSERRRPLLRWSFSEGDKEVLGLYESMQRRREIEWRFKDPEEYDD